MVPTPNLAVDLSADVRELEVELRRVLRSYLREVDIELSCHGLVLRGSAYSYHGKQLAQETVMRLSQLRVVANRISVK